MTAAELDELLYGECTACRRVYWWCECLVDERVDPTIHEGEIAEIVSGDWMSRSTGYDAATGVRIWARYRRAQGMTP